MSYGPFSRLAAAILALAAAGHVFASDVDARFDRSRARPTPVRNPLPAIFPDTRAAIVGSSGTEVTVRKDESVTLVVAPNSQGACTVEIKAR